jgi:hypothetical protein
MGDRPLGNPYFRDPDVIAFPFKRESFLPIKPIKSDRQIAFVDGGNLELLGAPNFSVQLNRIYACIWKDNKRQNGLKVPQIEFFSAIFSTIKDDEIVFETMIVPSSPEFSLFLPDLTDVVVRYSENSAEYGNFRANTSRIASIARNFAEWKFAEMVAESLNPDDVLVLDGSLQTQFQNEWKYFRSLEKITQERGIILTSLSKTSMLFTDSGISLLGAISQFANNEKITGEWFHPIFESRKHHVFGIVVKLRSTSDWVFRLDFQLDQRKKLSEEKLDEILNLFCSNACDPTFPGYPYGSIDADLFSRVSENEVDYYRALISSQISTLNRQGRFVPHMRAGDAHDVLNTIAGF